MERAAAGLGPLHDVVEDDDGEDVHEGWRTDHHEHELRVRVALDRPFEVLGKATQLRMDGRDHQHGRGDKLLRNADEAPNQQLREPRAPVGR